MANEQTTNPADFESADLEPEEANDVLLDVTDAQPGDGDLSLDSGQPKRTPAADPSDGVAANSEDVPKDPEEVKESAETVERLQRHGSIPSPKSEQ